MSPSPSILPPDVWALVFQHLAPSARNSYGGQEAFWQLPLVCRNFREAFAQQVALGIHIYVNEYMLYCHRISLLQWLHTNSHIVKSFEAPYWTDNGEVDSFFMVLSRCRSLTSVIARPRVTSELKLVGMLKSLTQCHLKPSLELDFRCLDLLPLQGLKELTSLKLHEGKFTNLSAAKHLRSLELVHTNAVGSTVCSFCSSLTKLDGSQQIG